MISTLQPAYMFHGCKVVLDARSIFVQSQPESAIHTVLQPAYKGSPLVRSICFGLNRGPYNRAALYVDSEHSHGVDVDISLMFTQKSKSCGNPASWSPRLAWFRVRDSHSEIGSLLLHRISIFLVQ